MQGTRAIRVEQRYLHLPVENGAPERWMRLIVDGAVVREFRIELAEGEADFWVYTDISPWHGHYLTMAAEPGGTGLLEAVRQDNRVPDADGLYEELLRPQYHFSSRRGWNNDPNGLMYYDGEYHLFYQHNPYGWNHGNMHWGHAISTDLVHWRELSEALYPDHLGTCFSGSGIVDDLATAGLQTGDEKTLICVYTSAGGRTPASADKSFTQSIAYSNDRGRSWVKYLDNPVLGQIAAGNRDPKVIWHEETRQWVMTLYLEGNDYALLSSPDLRSWTRRQTITLPGADECPDLFPLAVNGNTEDVRWVFWGANGTYLIGGFDGERFEAEKEAQRYDWGGNSYAAQTWSGIPAEDGRCIQIAWLRVNLPGMPFNQCMTFPCELSLRTTPDGTRLFSKPVREIALLRNSTRRWENQVLGIGQKDYLAVADGLLEIQAAFEVGHAGAFGLTVRGIDITYEVQQGILSCEDHRAPLAPQQGEIRLQVLVDRATVEIFGNDGQVALPLGLLMVGRPTTVGAFSHGGNTQLRHLVVHELRSAWASKER